MVGHCFNVDRMHLDEHNGSFTAQAITVARAGATST